MPLPNMELDELQELVFESCDTFVQLNVWPSSEYLNFRGWIDNFHDTADRKYALHLLNSFTFYNEELCNELLFNSVQSLSIPHSHIDKMDIATTTWKFEINNTVFVPVEGENPNITDSGIYLAGQVRRRLSIPEEQIMTMNELIQKINKKDLLPKRVVFFDDFIGSGNQFITLLETARVGYIPYDMFQSVSCEIRYCCFIATTYGLDNIKQNMPTVRVHPANVIDCTYSVVDVNSRIWPDKLRLGVDEFIRRSSFRANIPADEHFGFHNLALALAFQHTIPDASLPLFYHESPNWTPLCRRS